MMIPMVIMAIEFDDDRAFMHELYMQHHTTMMKMAITLTTSKADAEDVVSDACVSLVKNISVLRQLDCNILEGYIISTVKNAAYALHRKRKKRREMADGGSMIEHFALSEQSPVESIMYRCTIEMLEKAITQLQEEDQLVIRMKYFQKCTDKEIGSLLDIQEVSVRSRLTRIRRKLLIAMEVLENGK